MMSRKKKIVIGIIVAVVVIGILGSTGGKKNAATSTRVTKSPTTQSTTIPPTAASKIRPSVAWANGHPSQVASDCKAAATALATGTVTADQAVRAMIDGWNSAHTGIDGTEVVGVIATRCNDPKLGATLLVALSDVLNGH